MNTDQIIDLWTTDLTSGEFKQGMQMLRDRDDGFCCLGVLCERFRRETGRGEWRRDGDGSWLFLIDNEMVAGTLPSAVQQWSGLRTCSARYGFDDDDSLAGDNDRGTDFTEIAGTIREQRDQLFRA